MKKIAFLFLALAMIIGTIQAQNESAVKLNTSSTVTDADGNIYNTIVINTQTWLIENLKTTQYNDSTSIPLVTDFDTWINLTTTPAYCWYNNDKATYKTPYGALYNWYTVNTRKLCPKGWHIPSDYEWSDLISWSGGSASAGIELKEAGTSHWLSPNTGNNSTGFTALPGGVLKSIGFGGLGTGGVWWSSTEGTTISSNALSLSNNENNAVLASWGKENGFSVRCIKNLSLGTAPLEKQDESIQVYPNPVVDVLHVYLSQAFRQECDIDILSVEGNVLLKEKMTPRENTYQINVSTLPQGIYLCKIYNGKTVAITKFLKQ